MEKRESVDRIVAFNLTRIRKRLDMTQQNFADELGISRQAIFKYEQGLMKPDFEVILKLKKILTLILMKCLIQISQRES